MAINNVEIPAGILNFDSVTKQVKPDTRKGKLRLQLVKSKDRWRWETFNMDWSNKQYRRIIALSFC